jgi:hypothetical protein
VPLRRKGAPLAGIRATATTSVILADGATVAVKVGDWQILSGSIVLAVLADRDFPGPYEIVAEGTLILSKTAREAIERTAGIGATQTEQALVAAIDRLAKISIGDVRIDFSPGQLSEIQHRATKRGITVERALLDVIDRIRGEIFHTQG